MCTYSTAADLLEVLPSAHIKICICVCACVCTGIFIYGTCIYTYTYMYIYTHTYMYKHACVHMNIYTCVYVCVYVFTYCDIHTYRFSAVCVFSSTHTYSSRVDFSSLKWKPKTKQALLHSHWHAACLRAQRGVWVRGVGGVSFF